jgi:hypothetical protein
MLYFYRDGHADALLDRLGGLDVGRRRATLRTSS